MTKTKPMTDERINNPMSYKQIDEQFDEISPNELGTANAVWIKISGFDDYPKDNSYPGLHHCFECGGKFDTAIEMGYWKYDSGQMICRYCEPKLRNKRLKLRNKYIKQLIHLIYDQAKAEQREVDMKMIRGMRKNIKEESNMNVAEKRPIMGEALAIGYNQALDDIIKKVEHDNGNQ